MSTVAPILEQIGTAPPIVAKWLRIPDAVRVSGLCRSSLYGLMREGKIRSVCLRPSDGLKGVRLINADSLNRWIESQEVAYDESLVAK
jgi:hypothetical protein